MNKERVRAKDSAPNEEAVERCYIFYFPYDDGWNKVLKAFNL